jgi:stearoyl-CoA desaturase (delta-9 desaturase)
MERPMESDASTPVPWFRSTSYCLRLVRVVVIFAGPFLGLFAFSWSALAVLVILYVVTGLGITVGYHRLLTHRSFTTFKAVEIVLTTLGCLANQAGPLSWVAAHRIHHAHADEERDPHSPRRGFWWAQVLWLLRYHPPFDDPVLRRRYVPDLATDQGHLRLERYEMLLQVLLATVLYGLGELWGHEGLSWVVWGMAVRISVGYHVTALVNSATHRWGYRNYRLRDDSTNLWWVAWLTGGEGWHNNHHAFPRSARHGLRWWELDPTYGIIRLMGFCRIANDIRLPDRIICPSKGARRPRRIVLAEWAVGVSERR